MKNTILKGFVAMLAAAVLGGCVREEQVAPSPEGPDAGQVQITVDIPREAVPTTRAIAGGSGEAVVSEIDLLVFEAGASAGSPDVLAECVAGRQISQSTSDTDDYRVTFVATLTPNADATQLVVVANAHTQAAATTVGAPKQAVLAAMTVTQTGGWLAKSPSNYAPIPMYGERAVSGIALGARIEGIELTRMLARVDVVNSASNFRVTRVYLYRTNTAGYIAPPWNTTDGALIGTRPATPMIPSVQPTGSTVLYANPTPTDPYNFVGDIYAFESAAATGGTGSATGSGTFLVIEGVYNGGQTYFYRVDLTDPTGSPDPEDVPYMPVYRNHLYRVDITQVDGVGYKTVGDASKSQTVLSNLKTTLLVVDQEGTNELVFNGQYWLGVDESTFEFFGTGGSLPLKIRTNYTPGWTASDVAASGWITRSSDSGTGTDDSSDVTITVPQYTGGTTIRTFTFTVTAGRLSKTITVNQRPMGVLAAPGVIGYIEGTNTLTIAGSKEYAGTAVMNGNVALATGKPLSTETVYVAYFKFGSLVATSSELAAFTPGEVVARPSEWNGTVTDWTSIPHAALTGLGQELTVDGDVSPAQATGDPCVYWAEKNNWGGGWRLPSAGTSSPYSWHKDGVSPFGTSNKNWPAVGGKGPGAGWIDKTDVTPNMPENGAVGGKSATLGDHDWSMYLPAAGVRQMTDGGMLLRNDEADYWTSTGVNNIHGYYLRTTSPSPTAITSPSLVFPAADFSYSYGFPVRCVKPESGVRNIGTVDGVIGYYVHRPGHPDHRKLTMDKDDGDDSNGIVYVAYFKFGSLVAISSQDTKVPFTNADVVARPSEWTGTVTNWNSVPYVPFSAADVTIYGRELMDHPTVANNAAKGDPCAYWSAQNDWGGNWRLPTAKDNVNFVGRAQDTSWSATGTDLVFPTPDGAMTNGTAPLTTTPGTGNFPVENWDAFRPQNSEKLPAAGYHNSSVQAQGSRGFYWSSTASNGLYGNSLVFSSVNVTPVGNSPYDYGFVVRCTRQ